MLGRDKGDALRAVRACGDELALLLARPGAFDDAAEWGDDLTSEHPEDEHDTAALRKELSDLARRVREREHEAESLRARHRSLLAQNDTQLEELEQLRAERAMLSSKLRGSADGEDAKGGEVDIADLAGRLAELQQKGQAAEKAAETSKAKMKELQRDLKLREQELESTRKKLKAAEASAAVNIASTAADASSAPVSSGQRGSAEAHDGRAELATLQARIEGLEKSLRDKGYAYDMLRSSHSSTEEALTAANTTIRQLREEIAELEGGERGEKAAPPGDSTGEGAGGAGKFKVSGLGHSLHTCFLFVGCISPSSLIFPLFLRDPCFRSFTTLSAVPRSASGI
jgi:chromosome segregation ATPase